MFYQNNIFDNVFNNFNAILTILNSSEDFKVSATVPFSEIFCCVEASHLAFNESQLTSA